MEAGKLNRRVTLQSASESRDAFGAPALTWSNEATVWANVEPYNPAEYEIGPVMAAKNMYKVITRYRSDIVPTTDWRIQHVNRAGATQVFDIEAVQEVDMMGVAWRFDCREQV